MDVMRTTLTLLDTRKLVWDLEEQRVILLTCPAPQCTRETPRSHWVYITTECDTPMATGMALTLVLVLALAAIEALVATAMVTGLVLALVLATMAATEVIRGVVTVVLRQMATVVLREVVTETSMDVIREAITEMARETATEDIGEAPLTPAGKSQGCDLRAFETIIYCNGVCESLAEGGCLRNMKV
jgi:hypothetical protein